MFSIHTLFTAYGRPWREFREVVGARHTVLNRYKDTGLPLDVADKYAVRCDFHPVEVWGYQPWIDGLLGAK